MIVDDERPLVNVAEEMLAGLGYEPVGFSSSVDALAAFRAEPERYDIVLTDETMPDLTGTNLAREIRRLRADIPIVLMSGYSGPQLTERARSAGVSDVLRKPLVSRDIAEALARVVPGARVTAGTQELAVIRVSQAVSGEIVQEKQLEILMRTAIEQGAQSAACWFCRDGPSRGSPRKPRWATAGSSLSCTTRP